MDTYYCPHDLAKFAEMRKNRPELWEKYMAYYGAVFEESIASGTTLTAGQGWLVFRIIGNNHWAGGVATVPT